MFRRKKYSKSLINFKLSNELYGAYKQKCMIKSHAIFFVLALYFIYILIESLLWCINQLTKHKLGKIKLQFAILN